MGSFPETYNDPPLFYKFFFRIYCPPTPPLKQFFFRIYCPPTPPLKQIFFGYSKPDVLRRELGKAYDRANQSRQGSALVNVLIINLFERGRLFKS